MSPLVFVFCAKAARAQPQHAHRLMWNLNGGIFFKKKELRKAGFVHYLG